MLPSPNAWPPFAFIAPPCEDSDLDKILSDMLVPIPGIQKPYNAGVRQRLENEVLTKLLVQTAASPSHFKDIFTRAVRFELCASTYFHGSFSLSTGQQRKLDNFLRDVEILNRDLSTQLCMRASCAAGVSMNIDIRENHMLLSRTTVSDRCDTYYRTYTMFPMSS